MRRRILLLVLLIIVVACTFSCADFEKELNKNESTSVSKDKEGTVYKDGEKNLNEYVEGDNKITIGDVNNDNKTDVLVVDNSVISLVSGKKVVQEFEPDEKLDYKSINAIVNDIDGDDVYEIIVMASIGGDNPVFCLYLLDKAEDNTYVIRRFPDELSTLTTNTGIDAQVIPIDFLKYEIIGEKFSFVIDVARSYNVSTLDGQGYRNLTELWEEILDEEQEGQVVGVVRTEVVTNNEGKKVVRIYEMIYGADKKYIGALVFDITFDANGKYQILDYGLFEHSVLMP